MTEYSKTDFSADTYNSFRPTYPIEFIQHVVNHVNTNSSSKNNSSHIAIDVGCGTGQVTFPLFYNTSLNCEVYGTDPSSVMISKCKSLAEEKLKKITSSLLKNNLSTQKKNLEFLQINAEDLNEKFPESSVDLITAAECFHWFNSEKFYKAAYKILKPDGILAYWMYCEPILRGVYKSNIDENVNIAADINVYDYIPMSSKKFDEIYHELVLGDNFLGPYWQQPGRLLLISGCREVSVPWDKFEDMESVINVPPINPKGKLWIEKVWSFDDLRNYFSSWSALNKFVETQLKYYKGDDIEQEKKRLHLIIPNMMIQKLCKEYQLEPNDKMKIVWGTSYRILRKI